MAKKQTRRSISYSRADYEAAQAAAERARVPVAQLAAEALHEHLERGRARDRRQADVIAWARRAFGDDQAVSIPQRGLRLLEEAIEAFQAAGGEGVQGHELIDYVFGRPVGELRQELGGIGVTVLCLAAAAGISADEAERMEVERVLSKPLDYFRQRNAAKNAAGFLAAPLKVAAPADVDQLIDRSSVGAGLRDIEERGIDAHLVTLDEEMRAAEDAGADMQVMYDEDVQARKQAAQRRRR